MVWAIASNNITYLMRALKPNENSALAVDNTGFIVAADKSIIALPNPS